MTSTKEAQKELSGTPTDVTLTTLASTISSQRADNARIIVAIAGPPGSGKSTSAERLQALLEQTHQLTTQIVPMDGYHFDNAILKQLKLSERKGSPPTFDVGGLTDILRRLSSSYLLEDIAVPVFDRDKDLSRGSARLICSDTAVLLVEGNYLLMNHGPWKALVQYFDLTVMIDSNEAELRRRLMQRWLDLDYSEADAATKVDCNDMPNAKLVIEQSYPAHYRLLSD